MLTIFLQIIPFFILIALGFAMTKWRLIPLETGEVLTKFVFLVALPAMLFRFASNLDVYQIFDAKLVMAFLLAGLSLFTIAFLIARLRGDDGLTASMEANCSAVGNSGFMAIPILMGLFGPTAIGPLMLTLSIDFIFFAGLFVVVITAIREGRLRLSSLKTVLTALVKNPMVMSMILGVMTTMMSIKLMEPIDVSLKLLSDAATPCALFVIGVSLAEKTISRVPAALWISFLKLIIHPILVAFFALVLFKVDALSAGVIIGVAAMPTASSAYIVARQYKAVPERASSAIVISTILSLISLTFVLAFIQAS